MQLVAASAGQATTSSSTDDDDGDTLSIIALVVGGLGLVAGVGALVMTRRPRPAS